jgi:signal recognition particle subunit SEC65
MKFAVLAEDQSDAEAICVLVKRIADTTGLAVFKHGFSGCGNLRKKAGKHIKSLEGLGATHFIICHDADRSSPREIKESVRASIRSKHTLPDQHRIIVPVQEIEAWIIADEKAIQQIIPTLKIKPVNQPESLNNPKEWLKTESRRLKTKPLYDETTLNEKVCQHLDISIVQKKCQSFSELVEFVSTSMKNAT